MKAKCKKCNQSYELGYTGTVDGCDKCQQIERDTEGNIWFPKEKRQVRLDKTGVRVVTRKQAFSKVQRGLK